MLDTARCVAILEVDTPMKMTLTVPVVGLVHFGAWAYPPTAGVDGIEVSKDEI